MGQEMKFKLGDIIVEYYEEKHLATFITVGYIEETETQLGLNVLKNIDSGRVWKVHELKHFGGGRFKVIRSPKD